MYYQTTDERVYSRCWEQFGELYCTGPQEIEGIELLPAPRGKKFDLLVLRH